MAARRVATKAVTRKRREPEAVLVYRTVRVPVMVIDQFRARVWLALARQRQSVAGLARKLGVAARLVNRWLQDERLTEAALARLEAALGVERSYWSTPLSADYLAPHKSRAWTAGRVRSRVSARAPGSG
jgi:ribosome-binding protein aMBF1 (putative translation factor)